MTTPKPENPDLMLIDIDSIMQAWPDDAFEIIDNRLIRLSPSESYANIDGGQNLWLSLRSDQSTNDGWVFYIRAGVLMSGALLYPDVAGYLRSDLDGLDRSKNRHSIPPRFITEFVSPSNESNDRVRKMELYAAAGVAHYWIVDLRQPNAECYQLTDGAYNLVATASGGQLIQLPPFQNIPIAWADLLKMA